MKLANVRSSQKRVVGRCFSHGRGIRPHSRVDGCREMVMTRTLVASRASLTTGNRPGGSGLRLRMLALVLALASMQGRAAAGSFRVARVLPDQADMEMAAPPEVVMHKEKIVPSKWVFSYTTLASSPEEQAKYDEMVRAAVVSARKNTYLEPICIYNGQDSEMTDWLLDSGVKVIQHRPLWGDKVRRMFEEFPTEVQKMAQVSPLYSSVESVIAAMQRIDIPTLPVDDGYILYTDVDVVFAGPIDWEAFGDTPDFFTVGSASWDDDKTRWSAAVMLLNLDNLRTTYDEFIKHVFSEEALANGLLFGDHGYLAVGAYSSFYEDQYDIVPRPKFNWKAFWPASAAASIIHFEGPKPSDYQKLDRGHTVPVNLMHYLLGQECNIHAKHSGCRRAMKLFRMYKAIGAGGAYKEDQFWVDDDPAQTGDTTMISVMPTVLTLTGLVCLWAVVACRRQLSKLSRMRVNPQAPPSA